MNDNVYQSLIQLCTDICRRNGKKKLLWFADKEKSLSYEPAPDEMVITVHRWFASKSCPGTWLYERLGDVAKRVTEALSGGTVSANVSEKKGTQSSIFLNLTEAEAAEKIGKLCQEDMKKSGILASVTAAQFILESGYGKTELGQKANNMFGMKCTLSGNTWSGSSWDGVSKYTKKTNEEYQAGTITIITADFRKYPCVEDSIADHSAYLLGAMNGNKKRYEGLAGEKNYRKAIQIIKNGGYATDTKYVDKICNIIERFHLDKYNLDAKLDKTDLQQDTPVTEGFRPYTVRVSIDDLNIRKGPGTNYEKTGSYTGKGIFTIVEESKGTGSKKGWGRLKSGAGWISLDYTTKL